MIVSDTNTQYEKLSDKAIRISAEAWGVYANLPKSLSQRTCREDTGDHVPSHRRTDASLSESIEGNMNATGASCWIVSKPGSAGVIVSEVVRESFERLLKTSQQWTLLPVITSEGNVLVHLAAEAFTGMGFVSFRGARFLGDVESSDEPEWDEQKNDRRCDLVDKEIEETITPAEKRELDELQSQMLAYRRKIAPLPIAEARQLHQHLLRKAAENRAD